MNGPSDTAAPPPPTMLRDHQRRAPLILAVLLALFLAPWFAQAIEPPTGGSGLALLDGAHGLILSILLLLILTLPLAGAASIALRFGSVSMAAACVAGGWLILAWAGGPIDDWMHRHTLPAAYGLLIFELLLWLLAWLAAAAAAILLARPASGLLHLTSLARRPSRRDLPAVTLSTLLAAALAILLLQSTDSGQVIGGLAAAFALATAAAALTWPRAHPLAFFASPLLVPALAYLSVVLRFSGHDEVLAAWFDRSGPGLARVPGPALALPCHYASAAVLGCLAGLAWVRGITHRGVAEDNANTTASAAVNATRTLPG